MPVIGIIGHHVLTDPDGLATGVDEALDRIEAYFPEGRLVVIASLIEGADQLAVRRTLERPRVRTLVVFLPFQQEEFEREFRDPGSVQELRSLLDCAQYVLHSLAPHGSTRRESYLLAGDSIVARAQVLLAIWNGAFAGGNDPTGELVESARRQRIPIACVYAHDGSTPGARVPATREQGTVTFE